MARQMTPETLKAWRAIAFRPDARPTISVDRSLLAEVFAELDRRGSLCDERARHIVRLESWFPEGNPDGFGNSDAAELHEWLLANPGYPT